MAPADQELSQWMKGAQDGRPEDYDRLLRTIHALLSKHVGHSLRRYRLGEDEVQDVVQEILSAIHDKRHTYLPSQPFLPWMYAIAHYKVVDHLRRTHTRRSRNEPLDEDRHDIAAEEGDAVAGQRDWEILSAQLPDKQRRVLEMVKLEGLSVAEASLRTGYSASDIKITVHRAIRFLRDWVNEENG